MGRDADLIQASKAGNVAVIRRLLDPSQKGPLSGLRKTTPNANCQDDDGNTPLQHASLNGHEEAVLVLLQHNASCQISDNQGNYPLHMAAWGGHPEVVRILLEEGPSKASVNEANTAGDTALTLASQYGHAQVVRVLLNSGADSRLVNSKGEGPLDLASQYGHLAVVELLLGSVPALVNVPFGKRSPLHLATRNGHAKVVQFLLSAGADVNLTNEDGTALHEAALFGRLELVEILLRAGIETSLVDSQQKTAIALLEQHRGSRASKDIRVILEEAVSASLKEYRKSEVIYDDVSESSISETNIEMTPPLVPAHRKDQPQSSPTELEEDGPPKPARKRTVRILKRPDSSPSVKKNAEPSQAPSESNGHPTSQQEYLYGYSSLAEAKTANTGGNDLYSLAGPPTSQQTQAQSTNEDMYGYSSLSEAKQSPSEPAAVEREEKQEDNSNGLKKEDTITDKNEEEEEKVEDEGEKVKDEGEKIRDEGGKDNDGEDELENSDHTENEAPPRPPPPRPEPPLTESPELSGDELGDLSLEVNETAQNAIPKVTLTTSASTPGDEDLEWAQIDDLLGGLQDEIPTSFAEKPAASVPKSVPEWLEQYDLGHYADKLMNNGFDNLRFLSEDIMGPEELRRTGIRSTDDCNTIIAIASMLPESGLEIVEPESVAQWLESLCLSEYLTKLTKHGVDTVKKACAMWDTELWQLGIDKPGHRRRIMSSIRQLHALNPMLVGDVVLPDMTDEEIRRNVRTVSFSRLIVLSRDEPRMPEVAIQKDYRGLASQHVAKPRPKVEAIDVSVDTHERLPGVPEEDSNFDRNRPDVDRNTDPVELRTPKDAQEHNKKLLKKLGIETGGLKQMSDRWRHNVETLTTGCANYEARYLGSTLVKNFKGPVTTQEACQKMRASTAQMKKIPFITMAINAQSVKFIDTASKNVIQEHKLNSVLYISQDRGDNSVFGYITRDPEMAKLCYCHVFRTTTPKLADEIVMTLGQAFEVAYQVVKRKKALAVMKAFESDVEQRKKAKAEVASSAPVNSQLSAI